MNDLERFLQQAAERLADKVNKAEGRKPAGRQKPPAPPTQSAQTPPPIRTSIQGNRPAPARLAAEPVIEASLVDARNDRLAGPDPLSNIDTRHLQSTDVDSADKRMLGHMTEVFEHSMGAISAQPTNITSASIAPQVERKGKQTSALISMFRQPETLKAAFIASEIFRRKT
ncbi:MAG: hypothetical protein KDB03_23715 [Planctomycetales bacterium]|nr:hypothetical protein [Planctomycetales bacterium]